MVSGICRVLVNALMIYLTLKKQHYKQRRRNVFPSECVGVGVGGEGEGGIEGDSEGEVRVRVREGRKLTTCSCMFINYYGK